MTKKDIIIIADYSEQSPISFAEIIEMYDLSEALLQELIEYDILHPQQRDQDWLFDAVQVKRLQTAMRLQRDLDVNFAGIALVLDLMDELEELRARAAFLEKHILKT